MINVPEGTPNLPWSGFSASCSCQDHTVHRDGDGRQYIVAPKGSTRYLKRAASGGADDWRVFRTADGEYIASESGTPTIPALWCSDLFAPRPPPPAPEPAAAAPADLPAGSPEASVGAGQEHPAAEQGDPSAEPAETTPAEAAPAAEASVPSAPDAPTLPDTGLSAAPEAAEPLAILPPEAPGTDAPPHLAASASPQASADADGGHSKTTSEQQNGSAPPVQAKQQQPLRKSSKPSLQTLFKAPPKTKSASSSHGH